MALLTNFLPPYRVPFLEALEHRLGQLTILVSAETEDNRSWAVDHGHLTVVTQRSRAIRERWRHSAGFSEVRQIHLPIDTISRLRQIGPDVVISSELGVRTCLAARYARRHRTPLVCWATLSSETEDNLGWSRLAYRRLLARRVDHWFVNGQSGLREVARYGANRAKISAIPYATLPPALGPGRRRPAQAGLVRFLYVGQLSERKGIVPFVESFVRWQGESQTAPAVQLTVVGDGPEAPRVRRIAGLAGARISIVGPMDYDLVRREYHEHDVLVVPSLVDEWGMVVNEGMAAGMVVMGSTGSQAVQEMIIDGESGFVFEPIVGVEGALRRVAELSPALRSRVGRTAAMRAAEFGVDLLADRMARALRSAAGEIRKRSSDVVERSAPGP